MLTVYEQERFAFCVGSPQYEATAEACDCADTVEALELEISELQSEIAELQQWRDGDMTTRLQDAEDERDRLQQSNKNLLLALRTALGQLRGKECNNAAGRQLLAAMLQQAITRN
jgi:FtsZ-binding cell division protein ZapB